MKFYPHTPHPRDPQKHLRAEFGYPLGADANCRSVHLCIDPGCKMPGERSYLRSEKGLVRAPGKYHYHPEHQNWGAYEEGDEVCNAYGDVYAVFRDGCWVDLAGAAT